MEDEYLPYELLITGVPLFELPEDIDLLTWARIRYSDQRNDTPEVNDDYFLSIFCFCKDLAE